jgi:putative nucleotidyltransferase with HDIG domain
MSAVVDYKRKVYAIRDLPTLPVIAQRVLTLADDDDDCVEKLTKLISSDQSLSVKILALANSAYFGHRAKIGTVRHAVMVIGTSLLKQFSLSVLVCGMMGRGGKERAQFWKHSFATATAASMIAKESGAADSDLSFMAGLIHDVGRLVIDTYFPEEKEMEHTEVGGWMAERWQLPEPLVNAIAYHHSVLPEHLAQPVVACVYAANMCARAALEGDEIEIPADVCNTLKVTDEKFQKVIRELKDRRTQIDNLLM